MSNSTAPSWRSASDLTALSATALAAALREGGTSPREVLDAYLHRIETVNPSLNALVTICAEEAYRAAQEAERALGVGDRRPLLGVPFTCKDVIATAGIRTTCGSLLYTDYVPPRSATVVARLEAAGGILLAKSNTSEFALDPQVDNRLFGPARNPWDPARTPGGSSGGESAAIAACCSPLGLGTDYGGSVRFPAHCTGIASLRPSVGSIPSTGTGPSLHPSWPVPNSLSFQGRMQVIGPMARSVADLTLALRLLAGPDGMDALTVPVPLGNPAAVDVRSLRIAWCDGEGNWPVRSDLVAAIETVARRLDGMGLHVSRRQPAALKAAGPLYGRMRAMEGMSELEVLTRGHEAELSPWVQHLLSEAHTGSLQDMVQANGERDRLRAEMLAFFRDYQVLLLPVAALPAFPIGQRELEVEGIALPYMEVVACCRAISLFGIPAAVVPCGRSREGLPAGIQVVGGPFMEHVVLAVATLLESEFSGLHTE